MHIKTIRYNQVDKNKTKLKSDNTICCWGYGEIGTVKTLWVEGVEMGTEWKKWKWVQN